MKRMDYSSRLIEMFVKAGLVAAIAAALLVPTTVEVSGSESAVGVGPASPILKRTSGDALPLPPVPCLESMPVPVREPAPKGFKIDRLIGPGFEMTRQGIASAHDFGRPRFMRGKALDASSDG